jgi:hypothetical protein
MSLTGLEKGVNKSITALFRAVISWLHDWRSWIKKPEFWLTFAAYTIPLALLLYVLYINFLPFGYNKTFTITVGAQSDSAGAFHLDVPSNLSILSDRIATANGSQYRFINGGVTAEFQPDVALKNAQITVNVQSYPPGSVQTVPSTINLNLNSAQWNFDWNFATTTPNPLKGNASNASGCEYFDGDSILQFPSSSNEFESGPFTVYAQWEPEDSADNAQEIIGHYNWEILQNKTSVEFLVHTITGSHSISYSIDPGFFNAEHSLVAIYSPSTTQGYFELYVDNALAGYHPLGTSTISVQYGNANLTMGKDGFSDGKYLNGCIYNIDFANKDLITLSPIVVFSTTSLKGQPIEIPLISTTTTELLSVSLHAQQQ